MLQISSYDFCFLVPKNLQLEMNSPNGNTDLLNCDLRNCLNSIRSFLLVKKENSTCELDPSVAGFSLLVLCVCCEREKKGAAACFALRSRYFTCKESHGTFV